MIVGHFLLAFAVVVLLAMFMGKRGQAIQLGIIAGLFATAPDVDVIPAVASAALGGINLLDWQSIASASDIHRGITHGLLVAPLVTYAAINLSSLRGKLVFLGLLILSQGPGALASMSIFLLATSLVARQSRRWNLPKGETFVIALAGILFHPMLDVFLGDGICPFYPLWDVLFVYRIADPTFHLLFAWSMELLAMWLALFAVHRYYGNKLKIRPHTSLAATYGAFALILPPPTVESAEAFVTTIMASGILVGFTDIKKGELLGGITAILTGLTLATAAFAATYAALGPH